LKASAAAWPLSVWPPYHFSPYSLRLRSSVRGSIASTRAASASDPVAPMVHAMCSRSISASDTGSPTLHREHVGLEVGEEEAGDPRAGLGYRGRAR
jgi:hypothetical protein